MKVTNKNAQPFLKKLGQPPFKALETEDLMVTYQDKLSLPKYLDQTLNKVEKLRESIYTYTSRSSANN